MCSPQHLEGNGPVLRDERRSNPMQVKQRMCPQRNPIHSASSGAKVFSQATQYILVSGRGLAGRVVRKHAQLEMQCGHDWQYGKSMVCDESAMEEAAGDEDLNLPRRPRLLTSLVTFDDLRLQGSNDQQSSHWEHGQQNCGGVQKCHSMSSNHVTYLVQ
jgi:hypothetical protein